MATMDAEWQAEDLCRFVKLYLDGELDETTREDFNVSLSSKAEMLRKTATNEGEHQGICVERSTNGVKLEAMIRELENTLAILRDDLVKSRLTVEAYQMELKDAQTAASVEAKEARELRLQNHALKLEARSFGYAVRYLETVLEDASEREHELVEQVNAKEFSK